MASYFLPPAFSQSIRLEGKWNHKFPGPGSLPVHTKFLDEHVSSNHSLKDEQAVVHSSRHLSVHYINFATGLDDQ